MRWRGSGRWSIWLAAAVALAIGAPSAARAQINAAGIAIDADGVLRMKTFSDPTGQVCERADRFGQGNARPEGHLVQQAAKGLAQPA